MDPMLQELEFSKYYGAFKLIAPVFIQPVC